jgi:glycosyltransferase involved in cell wall biosynthesis
MGSEKMDRKNSPLVSVIIPTAHRSSFIILRAIFSVLGQNYPVFEVILVDDNTELSLSSEIKAALKNIPQVKYIKNIGSHGACAARNVGISCAKGELIAFLDDDDEWLPDKIERQVKAFTQDVVLVYCNGWRVDDRYNPPLIMPYRQKKDFFLSVSYESLLEKNHIGTTTQLLVRKSALEQIDGFDTRFLARQDYDLCLRLAKLGRTVGIDEFLFRHYLHNGEQISKSSKASLNGYLLILEKYQKDLQSNTDSLCSLFFKIARMHRLQCHVLKSVYYYLRAVFLVPSSSLSLKCLCV